MIKYTRHFLFLLLLIMVLFTTTSATPTLLDVAGISEELSTSSSAQTSSSSATSNTQEGSGSSIVDSSVSSSDGQSSSSVDSAELGSSSDESTSTAASSTDLSSSSVASSFDNGSSIDSNDNGNTDTDGSQSKEGMSAGESGDLETVVQQSTNLASNFPDVLNAPILLSPPPSEFTSTIYYNGANPLGTAGSFHVVGFGTVRLNAHTNGNILANTVYANANFGTNNLSDELSYIMNYAQVNSGSATSVSHVLAVGSSNTAEFVDNGNAIAINGRKLDRPKTVWQDSTGLFIDLAAVRSQVVALSATLSVYPDYNITENLNAGGGSVDESYITLSDSSEGGVFNITAAELSTLRYLGVKGFLSSNRSAVVINVDCAGVSQLSLPISLISVDNVNQGTSETHNFVNGRVIWNFYNLLPDSGTTITASLLHGSVLAPSASFTASQNLNGTIIANDININAESHRDDFVAELPTPKTEISIDVNKVWQNSDGLALDTDGYSAVVQLLQDGAPYGAPITLDATNNFSHTFDQLPLEYVYTIEEQQVLQWGSDVSGDFDTSITQDINADVTITNRMKSGVAVTLPATGGNSALTTAIGLLTIFISIVLLYQLRRNI